MDLDLHALKEFSFLQKMYHRSWEFADYGGKQEYIQVEMSFTCYENHTESQNL